MRLHRSIPIATGLALALSVTACAKDPSTAVPAAKVAEPAAAAEQPAAAPEAEAPAADKAAPAVAAAAEQPAPAAEPAVAGGIALSGDIVFVGSKVTGSHECIFKTWSGSFELADGKAEGGKVRFEVQTDSVVADYKAPNDWSKKLEGHLKSPDFFNVEAFPKATFESTEIKANAADGATHMVTGKLTIRGVTKDVSFPATIKVDGGKVEANAEFSIQRKDFGIEYPGKPDDLIREGVVLKIAFKG